MLAGSAAEAWSSTALAWVKTVTPGWARASAPRVPARLRLAKGAHLAKRTVMSGGGRRGRVAEGGEEAGGEGEGVDPEDGFDVRVEGGEVGGLDGPGEGRRAGGRGEDVRGEGEELAAPAGGGAAEGAEAAFVDAGVGFGGQVGAVEGLAAVFEGEAAGFEEVHLDAAAGEAHGEGEAGDAGSDDADGGVEGLAGRGLLEIDVQGDSLCAWSRRREGRAAEGREACLMGRIPFGAGPSKALIPH